MGIVSYYGWYLEYDYIKDQDSACKTHQKKTKPPNHLHGPLSSAALCTPPYRRQVPAILLPRWRLDNPIAADDWYEGEVDEVLVIGL